MNLKKKEKQVVSKKRVADHGEVYTGKREVNAMLDLVNQETQRIDSHFLEPACGIHATSKVYTFVPMQDFNESWTDEKLYKKYKSTKKEIAFIESMIRPMELDNE